MNFVKIQFSLINVNLWMIGIPSIHRENCFIIISNSYHPPPLRYYSILPPSKKGKTIPSQWYLFKLYRISFNHKLIIEKLRKINKYKQTNKQISIVFKKKNNNSKTQHITQQNKSLSMKKSILTILLLLIIIFQLEYFKILGDVREIFI